MLKPYWPYLIERNWNYTLSKETLRGNIFCYGKEGTGKTERVAIPVLMNAIKEGRSCVVYAEDTEEYADVRAQAFVNGYQIYDIETYAKEEFRQIHTVHSIIKKIKLFDPILVMISNKRFRVQNQTNFADNLLIQLALMWGKDSLKQKETRDKEKSTLIVLDGLCGNMVLPSIALHPQWLQYCVIMDDKIAYAPWRNKTVDAAFQSGRIPESVKKKLQNLSPNELMRRFFAPFETVICTGIPEAKNDLHREFVNNCYFERGTNNVSGRFAVLEKYSKEKAKNSSVRAPIETKSITEESDTASDATYSQIAAKKLRAGVWIVEHNGKMLLDRSGGVFIPIVFSDKDAAETWLKSKWKHDGIIMQSKDEDEDIIRYECLKGTNLSEYCLLHINSGEEEHHHLTFYMSVIQMAELDAIARWLETEEATNQGFDPKDGLVFNMRKYFAEQEKIAQAFDQVLTVSAPARKDLGAGPDEMVSLPEKGVLFLGGHPNMLNKLKQIHPGWAFKSDENFRPYSITQAKYIFYWFNHSSHGLMYNVFPKLAPDAEIMYVTATNMMLLENEMIELFIQRTKDK